MLSAVFLDEQLTNSSWNCVNLILLEIVKFSYAGRSNLYVNSQDNQRMSVKALGESLSSMQDKMTNYQDQIANLSAKFSNVLSLPPANKDINMEVSRPFAFVLLISDDSMVTIFVLLKN